jgi:hypothetical protein
MKKNLYRQVLTEKHDYTKFFFRHILFVLHESYFLYKLRELNPLHILLECQFRGEISWLN